MKIDLHNDPDLTFLKGVKANSVDIPNGYLESLEDTVMERWNKEYNVKRKQTIRYILSFAASVALILGMSFWILNNQSTETVSNSDLTELEAKTYLMDNIEDLDIETLTSFESNLDLNSIEHVDIESIDMDDIDESTILNLF